MPAPTTMGERIAALRSRRGLTQKELANRAGLSTPFISDIENDKRNVSSGALLKIADVLGASLDYLMKGEGKRQQREEPDEIPPELAKAAETENWSYSDTITLLEAKQMVRARRSKQRSAGKNAQNMSREDWIDLHRSLFN